MAVRVPDTGRHFRADVASALLLGLITCLYVWSLFLPVIDNTGRPFHHMDPTPGGVVPGFLALLLGWAACPLAWLANLTLAAGLLLLLFWRRRWRWAVGVGLAGVLLALSAYLLLQSRSTVWNQRFLAGYYLWLASVTLLPCGACLIGPWRERQSSGPRDWCLAVGIPVATLATVVLLDQYFSALHSARHGAVAVERILTGLQSPDPDRRLHAMSELSEISWEDALPTLVQALMGVLDDPEPSVRRVAAAVLVSRGLQKDPQTAAILAALARHTDDPDREVREKILEGLDYLNCGDPALVPALTRGAEDTNDRTRLAAVRILARLGPAARPALPAVIRCVGDPSVDVRREAVGAIRQIDPKASTAAPALALAVADRDPQVRTAALLALEQMGEGGKEALPTLTRLLRADTTDDPLRSRVLRVLMAIDPQTPEHFFTALRDPDKETRLMAIRGLGRQRAAADRAVPALCEAARDPDPAVVREALLTLSQMDLERLGKAARPAVALALDVLRHDVTEPLQGPALGTLSQGPPTQSEADQRRILAAADRRRYATLILLRSGSAGDEAVPALEAIRDREPDEAIRALLDNALLSIRSRMKPGR